MRRLGIVAVVAGVLVTASGAATPRISFAPTTASPGSDHLSVRVAGIRPGAARLVLQPGEVLVDPPFRVSRRGASRFHATVPNVPPGKYRLSVVRRGRTLARASRPLKITEAAPGGRGCESAVYGNLGDGWEQGSIRAGPLAFVGAARGITYAKIGRATKVLVAVDNGAVATVRVSEADRRSIALLYATRGGLGSFRRARRVADGLPAVRFRACEPGTSEAPTKFSGGFIIDKPLCAHLEVRVTGRPEPMPVAIPFGAPC